MDQRRIGDLLRERGWLSERELDSALSLQKEMGGLLGAILIRIGAVSEHQLLEVLSAQLDMPVLRTDEAPAPEQTLAFLEEDGSRLDWWSGRQAIAWRAGAEPTARLVCAAVDPFDPALRERVERADERAEYRLAPRAAIAALHQELGRHNAALAPSLAGDDATRLRELAQEAPVIELVNDLFAEASARRASDLHIEPFQNEFQVRMRVDGLLTLVRSGPRSSFDAICSRIKLLSGMDIGERRLPQDGRQTVRVGGKDLDLRVSTLPATWGESLVLRLLGKSDRLPEFGDMGMSPAQADQLLSMAQVPDGVVLVTGPTGSGKTTTIYRLLTHLNDGRRKIITVEDPVEFELPGVIQVNVRSEIGLSFAAGLRSILRQDPDVILVGEIRDAETAKIAVQAALTGHLVISTVHTNSALAAAARLLDLGVEDFLLADVLRGAVGQRLVRRLCPHCATPSDKETRRRYERSCPAAVVDAKDGWREPVGCPRCSGTGYHGRMGLYELARSTPELQSMLRRRGSEEELQASARRDGFLTLFEDGYSKASTGVTSLAEVHRVAGLASQAPVARVRFDAA